MIYKKYTTVFLLSNAASSEVTRQLCFLETLQVIMLKARFCPSVDVCGQAGQPFYSSGPSALTAKINLGSSYVCFEIFLLNCCALWLTKLQHKPDGVRLGFPAPQTPLGAKTQIKGETLGPSTEADKS